jgi:hypothetical protein
LTALVSGAVFVNVHEGEKSVGVVDEPPSTGSTIGGIVVVECV